MSLSTIQLDLKSAAGGWESVSQLQTVAVVAVQLVLAISVVQHFQLESDTFFRILLLASVGFVIHALLPHRHRLTFFLLLSLSSVVVALGIRDGLWLIVVGLSLIVLCHLPIRFSARVLLLVLTGVVHAVARAGVVDVPWSNAVWPILGSMFMFRIALYMYGLQHDPTPAKWQRSLAYFFMLPNVAYPLFPVVDYSSFGRTHYDAEASTIYQRGMQWIARGLLHLLLYRFVYLHMTIPAAEINDVGDLARSMLSTFLLYLRVSGQFHLAIGMLHLFGFHLPETHKLYYLASSFTDFWRRINIYWKDFMMKLVYYPSFFRLRRYGERVALIVATATVFVTTWLLHSYQWFWLRGDFPLTLPDLLFWGLLGVLVVGATLREVRRGRKRSLTAAKAFDWQRALRTTLIFCTLTILWSLWSADSVGVWLWQWSSVTRGDTTDIAVICAFLVGFFLVASRSWAIPPGANAGTRSRHLPLSFRTVAVLGGLYVFGQPGVYELGGTRMANIVSSLRTNSLSAEDSQRQFMGYYERLDGRGQLAKLIRKPAEEPSDERKPITLSELSRKRGDLLAYELVPSKRVRFQGAVVTTNQWGMRDKHYTLEKEPGVKRIALLGPSVIMGSGVTDAEVFDSILEEELNALSQPGGYRYEVLNFGVHGYSLLQQMALLDQRVFRFDPDVVIITMPGGSVTRYLLTAHLLEHALPHGLPSQYPELSALLAEHGLAERAGDGVSMPYASLRAMFEALGGHTVMPLAEARTRLAPIVNDIVAWAVARIGQNVRSHGAVPVLLGLDEVKASAKPTVPAERIARSNGFVVINLLDLYQGQNMDSLKVAAGVDNHPNARANRMIADRLLLELQKQDAVLKLGLSPYSVTPADSKVE